MTSTELLFHRIKENWKHKFEIAKTVFDWTVLVYIVIPAIIIFCFIYRSWWITSPAWIEFLPFSLLFSVFFFLLWGGYFRTYVREADSVFLRKNEELMLGMKRGGILLSYGSEIIAGLCLAGLISPFWFGHYGLSVRHLVLFLALWISLKWLLMAVNGRVNMLLQGWRALIRNLPIIVGAGAVWFCSYEAFQSGQILPVAVIFILNTFISIILIKERFTSVHTFEQDLLMDQKEKNKYTEMIFSLSMDMEKLPKLKPVRKNPRLYSRSNRIFRQRSQTNGFLELFIKASTRDIAYIKGYLQILGVTTAAIVFLPAFWLKAGIAATGYFFLLFWLGNVWHKLIGVHPFTKRYAGEEGYFKGKKVITAVLSIPYFLMCLFNLLLIKWIQSVFPFF